MQKGNIIYITSLKWPENKEVLIKSMTMLIQNQIKKIDSVQLLGCDEKIFWTMTEKGLTVTLPVKRPNVNGYVLKIPFK